MPDEAIYRCIEPSCARAMPRRVNFCPYCGTAQHGGAQGIEPAKAGIAPKRAPAPPVEAAPLPRPAPAAHAGGPPHAGTLSPDLGASASARVSARASAEAMRPNVNAGRAVPESATGPAQPRPAIPARPPERQPIRLRWWLLALACLWAVWFVARPSATKKIEARIDRAIVLAEECKSREAQSELIALRSTKATSEQLERLQQALNDAAKQCRRNRKGGKSLGDAGGSRLVAGALDGVARPSSKPRQGRHAQPSAGHERAVIGF